MRNRLEENQKVLVENQKRLKYWSEKLSKISVQNIRYVDEISLKHKIIKVPI